MKRILYLFFLLFAFAGCQKEEVTENLKLAEVSFSNNILPQTSVDVKYNGEIYPVPVTIPVILGEKTFEVFERGGEKIAEGTFNISADTQYYIYQPDASVKPTILTELPPPPPLPANPLDNVTPAPEGYMKINIKHDFLSLGFESIDVQVLAENAAGIYDLYTTIPNVTAIFSRDFVTIQRPVVNGVARRIFKFRFLNSITKAPFLFGDGQVFITDNIELPRLVYNAYTISLFAYESGYPGDLESNGKFYFIDPFLDAK